MTLVINSQVDRILYFVLQQRCSSILSPRMIKDVCEYGVEAEKHGRMTASLAD